MKVDGGRHCGNIRYEAEVDLANVVICHCTDCQTLTGFGPTGWPSGGNPPFVGLFAASLLSSDYVQCHPGQRDPSCSFVV